MESADTVIRTERLGSCDGTVCGTALSDEEGHPVSCVPHDHHLVVSGYNPLASPRYFAVPK